MHREVHDTIYSLGGGAVRVLLRVPGVSSALTWFSKVWLRQARLKHHLEKADYDAVIDGGANIGEFAAIVRLARPDLPLLCIEPHPPSAAILRDRGFQVVEAALWNVRGRLTLSQPSAATTSCTVTEHVDGQPRWEVDAVRLGELEIPGGKILVKLDLQGAELAALEGMGTLWDRCAALLLEVSYGDDGSYERIREMLATKGFVESATFNELDGPRRTVEADKLWCRSYRGSEIE